jgi:hypothetical protein
MMLTSTKGDGAPRLGSDNTASLVIDAGKFMSLFSRESDVCFVLREVTPQGLA